MLSAVTSLAVSHTKHLKGYTNQSKMHKTKGNTMTIKEINEALDMAYEEPKDLLGYAKCTFVSTTNPNFRDRINLEGSLRFSGSALQFISTEPFLRGSMRTSYVVSMKYLENPTEADLAPNTLVIRTRNSEYMFHIVDTESQERLKGKYWELPKELKDAYEELLSKYYGL